MENVNQVFVFGLLLIILLSHPKLLSSQFTSSFDPVFTLVNKILNSWPF